MDNTLRSKLTYDPVILRFGTSGRRGQVIHLTQLEVYLNALAELQYLQTLPESAGGIRPGQEFFYARDLRPSSSRFVPEQGGRGEIAQAIERAISDAGLRPVNLGCLPTPALTSYALERGRGSIMVTGSHIPFDRNGYKTNTARGELLKEHEAPIQERVEVLRKRLYEQPYAESLFDERGQFKTGHQELSPEVPAAQAAYVRRYTEFFPPGALRGLRLLAYQHSAVGRDLLVEILEQLGARVIPAGRSETFVPIDTENIGTEQLETIQALVDQAGAVDAVVSTDGDSDRPLLLGVERGRVRFFGGDLVGMVAAEFLGADAVVVPITCNDAVDRGRLRAVVEPKTRIGSPYVIAGMERARARGRRAICGWEANGGFLTGSDFERDGRTLRALPTRDAMLPLLAVLSAMVSRRTTLTALFAELPPRFSRAALLRDFPRAAARRILERFSPGDPAIRDILFQADGPRLRDAEGAVMHVAAPVEGIREALAGFFPATEGFGIITRLNYTDGVRIYFDNGDVAHVRPSGNADELRIYAVADRQERADEIARLGVAEPDGILRRLERATAASGN
ncbi:MAG TPA: phosphomannomutase [Verrucomicrobiota bacterium]|nr:phosphomannomutase [Verrucomicrobiota bacterium]HRT57981.1 phosphomannomutase [Candidatus Paceibacterota bacterium]